MIMILDGFKFFFLRFLYLFDVFVFILGLKVNYEKIEVFWIGVFKSFNFIFFLSKLIIWVNEKVFVLGVWFLILEDKLVFNFNFIEKIEKIRSILDNWLVR